MEFSILTIHPAMVRAFAAEGLLQKAQLAERLKVSVVNIRDFSEPPHNRVDDKPYGGGAGMVMMCEPVVKAIESVKDKRKTRIVMLSAKGKRFTQRTAERLSKYEHIILVSGRYEGIDERVANYFVDEELRVGDYVLMGGELAAGIIVESVARLIPGVLGNPQSLDEESFSNDLTAEHGQYTRPRDFRNLPVPEVLLQGDHRKIREWRSANSRSKLRRIQ